MNNLILAGELVSYDADTPHGLVFRTSAGDTAVDVELSHTDVAFALCAIIDRYGPDNVRRAVDRIALDDPTGRTCGIQSPAMILQGSRNPRHTTNRR